MNEVTMRVSRVVMMMMMMMLKLDLGKGGEAKEGRVGYVVGR